MTTLNQGGLGTWLEGLGLGPIPEFAEAHVLNKPLDIGRSYLADTLRSLVQCDPILAYKSILWPNDIFTADLSVPLPKLSPGANPQAFGTDLRQRVSYGHFHLLMRSHLTWWIVPEQSPFRFPVSRWSETSFHVHVQDNSSLTHPLYR